MRDKFFMSDCGGPPLGPTDPIGHKAERPNPRECDEIAQDRSCLLAISKRGPTVNMTRRRRPELTSDGETFIMVDIVICIGGVDNVNRNFKSPEP